MNPAKKIGLVFVALLLVVLPLVSPARVFAQGKDLGDGKQEVGGKKSKLIPNQKEFEKIVQPTDDGKESSWSLESYGVAKIYGDFGALNYGIMGPTQGGTEGAEAAGLVPQMGNAISFMISQPPASAELWLADALQNSPFVPPAYAQGVGFKSLTPILPIWKTFRDLAYICFIFVFAGIGFAIMFRKKIGGQAVATISNAIPRLVVTLILITFSYAIAGLLIDVMYISIYFISSVFTNLIDKPASELVGIALSNNIFQNGIEIVFGGFKFDTDPSTNSVASAAALSIGQIVQGFFSTSGIGAKIGEILGTGANVVGFLIIALAIMFAVVKTFFELLKSYVTFIIMVIFSPFQLLLGAFKENGDVVQWLRNMAATLAPFPVVITMIFLAMTLGGYGKNGVGFQGGVDVTGGFQPPQLRLSVVDSAGGGIGAIQGLIVIGLLMLIPEAVELSKKALKATDPMGDLLPKIVKNVEKGWKGDQLVPGIGPKFGGASSLSPGKAGKWIADAQPFGFAEGVPFRTTGKETGLERVLIGSRQSRSKELDYQKQARLFGKRVNIRQGGIVGAVTNLRGDHNAADKQSGGGAGSDWS